MIVKVCVGSACYVRGSHNVISRIKSLIELNNLTDKIELKASFCLGHCTDSVCVTVDDNIYTVNEDEVDKFFEEYIVKKVNLCK
ncbi:NAD(P)H-dependent oxidoreductase subunit E [Clostridium sp. UBA7503]|uniref:NAD(P)H-dependent oxidoreductase subunit E n=1 Tax=Clostridium sp. UBA7503 TaxID=1946377 RepID=UPI003217FE37